ALEAPAPEEAPAEPLPAATADELIEADPVTDFVAEALPEENEPAGEEPEVPVAEAPAPPMAEQTVEESAAVAPVEELPEDDIGLSPVAPVIEEAATVPLDAAPESATDISAPTEAATPAPFVEEVDLSSVHFEPQSASAQAVEE